MSKEIERKYLVQSDCWRDNCERSIRILQAYLANTEKTSVRIRLSDDRADLNIKSTYSLIERDEYNYEIPWNEGRQMLESLCESKPLEKTRHIVQYADRIWEIDEFGGRNAGLIIAEIELGNASEEFEKPPWLGIEVTDFERFYSHRLAHRPYLDWQVEERKP